MSIPNGVVELPTAATVTRLKVTPRVDLLPPELHARAKALVTQRWLRVVMLLALLLVVAAIIGAWFLANLANTALAEEQNTTLALQGQRAQYQELQNAIDAVGLGEAAITVGGSTEVDWQDYLNRVVATLPAGVALTAYTVDASTVTNQYPQSTVPLQGARVATLTFTAVSSTLPEVPSWLDNLAGLPGYVDATPGSITLTDGAYGVSITMHIDAVAYSNRVVAEEAAETAEGDAESEEAAE